MTHEPLAVAVFASGGGSNFQALADHAARGGAGWRVALLVTNREASVLDRARAAQVPSVVIPTRDRPTEAVAADTMQALEAHGIDVVLLAGYLRLLPSRVVRAFSGRMLNIHPALLPEFGGPGMYGMNVHRAVLASGAERSGCSVHFVDEEYDGGPVLARMTVPVEAGDTPEVLAARILEFEHVLYPAAVDHLCTALRAGRDVEPMPDRAAEEFTSPSPTE